MTNNSTPAAHKILVVDDDCMVRMVHARLLEREGYQVVQAENGAQAVALTQEHSLSAILMDINMPIMNGLEAAKKIRMQEKNSQRIPIIGITATEVKSILKKKHAEFLLNQELIKMVEIGDLVEVQKLISEGANLHKLSGMQLDLYNARSEHDTLLHTAVKLGHVDIVKYLISCGCNVYTQTRRCKAAPLHYATYPSVPAIILDILLDNGADLEVKDDDNATPFMWACYLNNTRAIKILANRKADVFTPDNFGLSPLEWASHQGHLESVNLLVDIIPYSNLQIKSAYTQAVDSGQTQTANLLDKQLRQ